MNCSSGGANAAVELGTLGVLVVSPLDNGKFNMDDKGQSFSEVNSSE